MVESNDLHPDNDSNTAQDRQSEESITPNIHFKGALKKAYQTHVFVPEEIDQRLLKLAEQKFGSVKPPVPWFAKYVMPLSSAAVVAFGIILWMQFEEGGNRLNTVAMNDRAVEESAGDNKMGKRVSETSENINEQQRGTTEKPKTMALEMAADNLQQTKKSVLSDTRKLNLVKEDFDRNGSVDILDAFMLAKAIENVEEAKRLDHLNAWDMNRDGKVNATDVEHVAKFAVSLRNGRAG